MIIKRFVVGPLENNCYFVGCPETKEAAIIDPACGSFSSLKDFLSEGNWRLKQLLVTHSHWDHVADAAQFKQKLSVSVAVHHLDKENLVNPGSDQVPLWRDMEPVEPDLLLHDQDKVAIGNLEFCVIHTPGHTPGGVCFWCEKEGALFSGDTLFKGSIGNLSLPTAEPKLMWQSLAKLAKLPPKTIVYPGHGPSTTLEEESWLDNAEEIFGY